ncbi:hypothetical protein IJS98_01815 [bacterium]|nr:hypothetical protein [bacterium]
MKIHSVTLVLLIFAASVFAENIAIKPAGTGSADDPFLINKIEHLVWMGENITNVSTKNFRLTSDINAAETKFWNDGRGFLPIGYMHENKKAYASYPFRGCFDGGGHIISNLFINRKEQGAALFARIGTPLQNFDFSTNVLENLARRSKDFATVKDLALVNCDFFGKDLAAGLSCNIDFAMISRVYISGKLKSEKTAAGFSLTCNNSCLEECETDIEFRNRECSAFGCFTSSQNTVLKNYLSLGSFQYSMDDPTDSRIDTGYSARTIRKTGKSYAYYSIILVGGGNYYLYNCLVLNSILTDRRKDKVITFSDSATVHNSFYSAENIRRTLNDNNKVGISNEKLRKKETYKNWDFDTVWEIEDGKSFPKLRKLEKMLKRL